MHLKPPVPVSCSRNVKLKTLNVDTMLYILYMETRIEWRYLHLHHKFFVGDGEKFVSESLISGEEQLMSVTVKGTS